ncbi:sperm-associated microtubule inner protein 4 [Numenius arquata]|uniref:sperm-associated microtubule inner protein 4 n=1 Tax=Numenius arquata TaxID=31919 RepID=UPI003D3099E0
MMLLHDLPCSYRQIEGPCVLSRAFESNEVLTPLQIPSRPTVSQDRYKEFRESFHCCKLPWEVEKEHGAIALPVLPEDHREKDKSPCTFIKRHQHYSSGVDPWPRGLPTKQYRDVTQLKKIDTRMNDELLHKPPNSLAKPLCLPFPICHPYQTHISRYAMFPNFRSPEDQDTGTDASSHQPFHPNIPTKAFDVVVLGKTRGNPYRHEVVSIPSDSQKKAVHWPGQHTYFQVRRLEHNLSRRTTNMLRNTERTLGITTYNWEFTGRGPMNPLMLDNHYLKAIGRLTRELGEDVELKETFLPSLSQVRPLEGRTACLLQGRRPRQSILQEHSSSVQMPLPSGRVPTVVASYSDTMLSRINTAASLSQQQGLPLDVKIKENRMLLHKVQHQETCRSACRPADGPRETALSEWIPSCEVPRCQPSLLELQRSFSKTAAQKHFHTIRGETKDLRDNTTKGMRDKFYSFNAFYFFN